jgi:hypothetical protein
MGILLKGQDDVMVITIVLLVGSKDKDVVITIILLVYVTTMFLIVGSDKHGTFSRWSK